MNRDPYPEIRTNRKRNKDGFMEEKDEYRLYIRQSFFKSYKDRCYEFTVS